MTLRVVGAADAEGLFTAIRDSTFSWTVAEVPELMRTLGWSVVEEIPGTGAVASTPWGVPGAEAELLYREQTVQSVTIYATNHATDELADKLAVVDAFASLTAVATHVLGPPTATFPGDVPRAQWRLAATTATLQNVGLGVLIDWFRNEYQDFNDPIGRY